MSQHHAAIHWHHTPHAIDGTIYSRNHVATLNGQQSANVSVVADAVPA